MTELFNLVVEQQVLFLLSDESTRADGPSATRALIERERLQAGHFYKPAHGEVFRALLSLLDQNTPADHIALWAALKGNPTVKAAGGIGWLTALVTSAQDTFATSLPVYAATLRDLGLRRRMVDAAKAVLGASHQPEKDPGATLTTALDAFGALTRGVTKVRTLSEHLEDVLLDLDQIQAGKKDPMPSTGLSHLDAVLGGMQPELWVIGAMPGVGKSALVATFTQALAQQGKTVGVFSLEDEAKWLAWRLLADESKVNQFILRNKPKTRTQMERISAGASRLYRYGQNVIVDDRSALSPTDVVQTARDMILNRGCKAILVDHFGELKLPARNDRHDLAVDEGLAQLRDIAKNYRIPVLVCAHLKREGVRPDVEPKLNDFANGSAFEKKARVALGLSRVPGSDVLKITVLKQTNGANGVTIEAKFRGLAAMVADAEGAAPEFYTEGSGDGPEAEA